MATSRLMTRSRGAEGGGKKRESPSPTASDDGIERPEIKLPKDVKNVFEGGGTGDAKKDAILATTSGGSTRLMRRSQSMRRNTLR